MRRYAIPALPWTGKNHTVTSWRGGREGQERRDRRRKRGEREGKNHSGTFPLHF